VLKVAQSSTEAVPSTPGKTILVVDDEPDLAATLAEVLAGDGHHVEVAAHGAIALEMLERRPYDLIVGDTKMPVLDGERFYGELERRFPRLARRILFLTGDVLNREKREFFERTGAPYILKPFDVHQVRQTVRRMLAEDEKAGFKILVIDDDPLVLKTLVELLQVHGHSVLAAPGGPQGLALAHAERPELILLDYHMPEMNGLAVVERLKGDAATRSIPVVALTSGTADDANRLIRAGCIGFIPKPFEAGTLPGLITGFLRATVARDRRAASR